MSGLQPFRRRLDELDEQIARLLGERFEVCREVARYKSEHEIPMMQPERVVAVPSQGAPPTATSISPARRSSGFRQTGSFMKVGMPCQANSSS